MKAICYWKRAFVHAWKNTRTTLGHNWKKTISGSTVVIAAFAIYGIIEGDVLSKVQWWLACIGATTILFAAVFGYKLLMAPCEIEDEKSALALAQYNAITKQLVDIQNELMRERSKVGELRTELAKQRLGLSHKVTRIEIERWIESGNRIISKIEEKARPPIAPNASPFVAFPPELSAQCSQWTNELDAFVKNKAPEFLSKLVSYQGLPPRERSSIRQNAQFADWTAKITTRIDRLHELLEIIQKPATQS
jgi:hypothetical protein